VRSRTTTPATWIRLGTVLTAVGILALVAGGSLAGAATGWSRTPASGFAGATIHVASSSGTLCRWDMPTAPTERTDPATAPATDPTTDPAARAAADPATSSTAPTTVDGSRVELRLERAGVAVPVGSVPVTPGGAWAGDFTVPTADRTPAGAYQLIPTCVVDDPALDGVRSFDFDPQWFGVVEGPPPTTVTAPPTIPPPITISNATEVAGAQVTRAAANTADQGPTLPRTGDGTLAIGLAGAAAVIVGAGALWWGARAARRARLGAR
jgi:hypothetical protein